MSFSCSRVDQRVLSPTLDRKGERKVDLKKREPDTPTSTSAFRSVSFGATRFIDSPLLRSSPAKVTGKEQQSSRKIQRVVERFQGDREDIETSPAHRGHKNKKIRHKKHSSKGNRSTSRCLHVEAKPSASQGPARCRYSLDDDPVSASSSALQVDSATGLSRTPSVFVPKIRLGRGSGFDRDRDRDRDLCAARVDRGRDWAKFLSREGAALPSTSSDIEPSDEYKSFQRLREKPVSPSLEPAAAAQLMESSCAVDLLDHRVLEAALLRSHFQHREASDSLDLCLDRYCGRSPTRALLPSTSQAAFLPKGSLGARAPSTTSISHCAIQSIDDVQFIEVPNAPEQFLASSYPDSKKSYWSVICQQQCQIGLQFESGSNYHLNLHESLSIAGFDIKLTDRHLTQSITHRLYEITHDSSGVAFKFHHMSLNWPDRSLPNELHFQALVTSYSLKLSELQNPRVHIHCRAGHGRTGTFIYLRALMSRLDGSAAALLEMLRSQRKLVDTPAQEQFAIRMARKMSRS